MSITICGKAAGARRPLFSDFAVPVPPSLHGGPGDGNDGFRLRDLITHVVRTEVARFRQRQEARRFLRVLSEREIEQGAARGKIEAGGSDLDQSVDEAGAIEAALQAFEDGLYLVVLDGEELRDLDQRISVGDDSTVTFVRLTFLAGA